MAGTPTPPAAHAHRRTAVTGIVLPAACAAHHGPRPADGQVRGGSARPGPRAGTSLDQEQEPVTGINRRQRIARGRQAGQPPQRIRRAVGVQPPADRQHPRPPRNFQCLHARPAGQLHPAPAPARAPAQLPARRHHLSWCERLPVPVGRAGTAVARRRRSRGTQAREPVVGSGQRRAGAQYLVAALPEPPRHVLATAFHRRHRAARIPVLRASCAWEKPAASRDAFSLPPSSRRARRTLNGPSLLHRLHPAGQRTGHPAGHRKSHHGAELASADDSNSALPVFRGRPRGRRATP